MTNGIRDGIAPLQRTTRHRIDCLGLSDGPPGINTQADVEAVIPLIESCINQRPRDAYVLACFSDPGIRHLRRSCGSRIFGIGECAYLQAMSLGDRFGVISTVPEATARHRRYLAELGFIGRLSDDLPLDLGVTDLESEERTSERVFSVAESLVAGGADVLILGCAGMSKYQERLRDGFGKPVIEPTVAALQLALGSFYPV